jgi:hypothetical protein
MVGERSNAARNVVTESNAAVVIEVADVFAGLAGDGALLDRLFAANGPYWNQGRYLSAAGAASQMPGGVSSTVGVPWYRQDWALGGNALVEHADSLLGYPPFAEAASAVFGGTVVRPHTLYANVQLPAVGTDFGHTDVPEFRGVTRDRYPVALLHLMNRSQLFAAWQLDICTAVTWLWRGPGGDFVLWQDGPHIAPRRYAPPLTGRAVVSDNDRVFHAVGDFASADGPDPMVLTPTSEVHVVGDRLELRDGAVVQGSWPHSAVRRSLSWKAYVFADDRAANVYDDHSDDLDEQRVLEVFAAALDERGIARPARLSIDDSLVSVLASVWPKPVPVPR